MKKGLPFLALLCFSLSLNAQPYVDILNLQVQSFSNSALENNSQAELHQYTLKGNLNLPVPLKNGVILLTGMDFVRHDETYMSQGSYGEVLSSTGLQLGGIFPLKKDKISLTALFLPRQAADLADMNRKDIQLGGAALVTITRRENMKLKFGLFYNREFFGNYFMPLAGIDWRVNDKLNIFGILPGSMNIEYRLTPHLTTGIAYRSITATFRSEGNTGDYYVREGHTFWADQQLSCLLTAYPIKNIAVYGGAGISPTHYFQLYDQFHHRDTSVPVFQENRPNVFLYGGIAYRVWLE